MISFLSSYLFSYRFSPDFLDGKQDETQEWLVFRILNHLKCITPERSCFDLISKLRRPFLPVGTYHSASLNLAFLECPIGLISVNTTRYSAEQLIIPLLAQAVAKIIRVLYIEKERKVRPKHCLFQSIFRGKNLLWNTIPTPYSMSSGILAGLEHPKGIPSLIYLRLYS